MSRSPFKAVGLNNESRIHYTDHLAVICIILGIPLLFVEEKDRDIALKYYPGLEAHFVPFQHFSPEYLAEHYDGLVMSDLWDRRTVREKFGVLESFYNKTMRVVHVPHGFSDKGFYLSKVAMEDIALIYGQNMLDMLKAERVFHLLNQYVITGNYRYPFYRKHKEFYQDIVQREVFGRFAKKQPTILYAPTWLDLQESSTFFSESDYVLGQLPDHFNMLVKLHPRLVLDDTVSYYRILGKYDKKPNIVFVEDNPLIYPLLEYTDIYLGDMSSIGYDFLPFNRPMFFLNKFNRSKEHDRGLYLFRCGIEVRQENFAGLYSIIEKNLPQDKERFTKIREEVYAYTFGEERDPAALKSAIEAAWSTQNSSN